MHRTRLVVNGICEPGVGRASDGRDHAPTPMGPPSPAASALVESPALESARAAGLRYLTDTQAGIERRRAGKGFSYRDPQGRRIQNRDTLERIRRLAVPPAWTQVWISPLSNSHLQATGRDARGRKQYRYHAEWRAIRDETKFGRLLAFAEALPRLRERVDRDLATRGLSRRRVLATVVRLLETTLIRVGNEEYARQNQSYGLTTLRSRHVDVSGETLRFEFRGKSGKQHSVEVHDRRVARIVRQCRDLPGHELFQYVDEEGGRQAVTSDDVNDYLREITGELFSAKDFRTWGGTVLALSALLAQSEVDAPSRRAVVVETLRKVAAQLGNRPAVCRKYYVHPAVTETFLAGRLDEIVPPEVAAAGYEDAAICLLREVAAPTANGEAGLLDKLDRSLRGPRRGGRGRSQAKRATRATLDRAV
jgi:DNA topoisomerase-1